jgi:DNA-binding SARP family transcriptional activator/TolB-like protein/Tfp pilus assembly protein PilF
MLPAIRQSPDRSMELRTLGNTEIIADDGLPVPTLLAQPKRLVLLAYLCVETARRPVRRARLIDLFWPDSDEERGRGSLRQALHFLRAALGADVFLRASDEDIAIDRERLRCDAVELMAEAARNPAAAADLFHGDFLVGLVLADIAEELEDWLAQTRLALRETASAAARSMQQSAIGSGESSAAIYWGRRIVALGPDDEDAARTLIELLWRGGDRAGALRAFESLKRTLERELDVAPDARTLALVQKIREHDAAGAPERAPATLARVNLIAPESGAEPPRRAIPRELRARSVFSIAVLPFLETGAFTPSGYLGAGLADELHTALSRCSGIRVASRAASFSPALVARDIATLRAALDVDWVVDGTVGDAGDDLHVDVRVIELATGRAQVVDAFDIARADVHGACRRLIPQLLKASGTALGDSERAALDRRPTADPHAYDAFLKGRYHWRKRPRDSALALESLREAIGRDASFALAHAALADVYNTLGSWEAAAMPSMQAFPKAQDAALGALCIDPHCAEAHTSLGYAAMHYLWQWEASGRQFERALALNPNYAHAHHWHSHHLMARGKTAASLESSLRALALDPLDLIINAHLAWHYWLAGEPGPALEQARRTGRLDERDHWVHFFSGLALTGLGDHAQAIDAQRRALKLSGNSPVMSGALGYAYAAAGERAPARKMLAQLPELAHGVSVAYEQAVIAASLGDGDGALDRLSEAYRERSAWLAYVAVDPRLAPLHGAPRFQSLLAAVGLDDVQPASGA